MPPRFHRVLLTGICAWRLCLRGVPAMGVARSASVLMAHGVHERINPHSLWSAILHDKYGRSFTSTSPLIRVQENSNWRLSFAIPPRDPHRSQSTFFGSRLLLMPWSLLDARSSILSILQSSSEAYQQNTMHLSPLSTRVRVRIQ